MLKEFKSIRNTFCENKNKKIESWLKYKSLFENQGKQGIVGIMETLNGGNEIVFKISQDINYTTEHEFSVMESLNKISSYCPHFCKSVGMLEGVVEPRYKKGSNPFNVKSKHGIKKKILLIEYIKNCYKLYNYIKSRDVPEEILYSTIKQVLLALKIAQQKRKFTHYDLHSCNIIMKKCDKDLHILYVIDNDNIFIVPSYGYYPVIIDYGFSYVKDMENRPLLPSLGHTNVGFNSYIFDTFSDPKLFLVTVADEIFEKRHSPQSKKFKRIVGNMFKNFKIDWKSGWDDFESESASDYIGRLIKTFDSRSKLFDEYDFFCIDLIQSLIILPLEQRNYGNIESAYNAFVKEWNKIEQTISSVYYNLYILKKIVDAARIVRSDYLNSKFKYRAIAEFKKATFKVIDEVTSFCNPKDINFEVMLCSLYVLSNCFEGIFFDVTNSTLRKKNDIYKKIPISSLEEIYTILEVNIPSKYTFDQNSKLLILDSVEEKSSIYNFENLEQESIDIINGLDNMIKPNVLYNIMKK